MNDKLYEYLLCLGDNALVIAHRLSELCGHGPTLESDIALTNISLDLFGQVRSYFQYAAEIKGGDTTEDSIAFSRFDKDYRNVILTEQPNTDFAYVIARQFLFDAFHYPLLEQLMKSKDERIAAIAEKSIKEVKYHIRFSSAWMKRLGDGTDESRSKLQTAVEHLYPFVSEFFRMSKLEKEMADSGIGADLTKVETAFYSNVKHIFTEATIEIPELPARQANGKTGIHSEYLGHILAELQFMQRAYPSMEW